MPPNVVFCQIYIRLIWVTDLWPLTNLNCNWILLCQSTYCEESCEKRTLSSTMSIKAVIITGIKDPRHVIGRNICCKFREEKNRAIINNFLRWYYFRDVKPTEGLVKSINNL